MFALGAVEHWRKPLNALWMYRWLMTMINLTTFLKVLQLKLLKIYCPASLIESQFIISYNPTVSSLLMLPCHDIKYPVFLNLATMTHAQLKLPRLSLHSVPISQRAESECLGKKVKAMAFCHAPNLLKHDQHREFRQILIGIYVCVAPSYKAISLLHLESVGTINLSAMLYFEFAPHQS